MSPRNVGGFLFWTFLAVAVLIGLLLVRRRRPVHDTPAADAVPAPDAVTAQSPPRPLHDAEPVGGSDLVILTFARDGAERAYAGAVSAGPAPWQREVAFVETHRHGRIVFRGTFAGQHLDADDLARARPDEHRVLAVLRSAVPEGCSALVVLATPAHVDALFDAFRGQPTTRTSRHRITASEATALAAAVAGTPAANRRLISTGP